MVRPDNQLGLSEKDLGEEIVKTLTATNPSAPKNVVHFNMRDRVFKLDPMVDQLAQHYSTDGYLLHHHSEEAKRQLDQAKAAEEAASRYHNEASLNLSCSAFHTVHSWHPSNAMWEMSALASGSEHIVTSNTEENSSCH